MVVAASATLDLFLFLQEPFELGVNGHDLALGSRRGLFLCRLGRDRGNLRCARLAHFGPAHAERLAALLPLFALRWCAIVLSDLLPERRAHRIAANSHNDDIAVIAAAQLAKAEQLLGAIEPR